MKKNIMALLLGVVICMGAVACGSKADSTTEAATETSAPAEKYVLVGEELGEYGRKVILNKNTELVTH